MSWDLPVVIILVLGEGWFGYHPNSRREMESPDGV